MSSGVLGVGLEKRAVRCVLNLAEFLPWCGICCGFARSFASRSFRILWASSVVVYARPSIPPWLRKSPCQWKPCLPFREGQVRPSRYVEMISNVTHYTWGGASASCTCFSHCPIRTSVPPLCSVLQAFHHGIVSPNLLTSLRTRPC